MKCAVSLPGAEIAFKDIVLPNARIEILQLAVKVAMFDSFGSCWSVCRLLQPSRSSNQSATVAMIVMEPAIGRMEVSMLPAQNSGFRGFSNETKFANVAPDPIN